MEYTETLIPGCFLIPLSQFKDNRGSFTKIFSAAIKTEFSFHVSEFSVAEIAPGLWRSGKINLKPYTAAKLFYCIDGSVTYRIADLRKGSLAYSKYYDYLLSKDNAQALYMPKGCVNWEISEIGATIVYAQSADYHKDSELAIEMNKLNEFDSPFDFE